MGSNGKDASKGELMAILMDAAEVNRRLAAGERLVLLDVRWVLGRTDGHEEYLSGHLPGAVFVDLPSQLADHVTLTGLPLMSEIGRATGKCSCAGALSRVS